MRPSRRVGSESSRDHSSLSLLQHQRRKGAEAWRRRRKRRERRRWWWRPLASVRWRRRWWRGSGRGGWARNGWSSRWQKDDPRREAGLRWASPAPTRACNCPSRTSPLTCPVRVSFRQPDPFSPGPDPSRMVWLPFPKLPGLRSSPHMTRVTAGRTGCASLRSAPGLPLGACPTICRTSCFMGDLTPVCAPPTFRLRDAAPLEFSHGLRATRSMPPSPHLEFSGPAPCTEGRGSEPGVSCCRLFLSAL